MAQSLETELKGDLQAACSEHGRLVVKGSESVRVFSPRERLFDSYKDVLALQLSASRLWIQNAKVCYSRYSIMLLIDAKAGGVLDTQYLIKKIVVGDEVISVWEGKAVYLYRHYPEIDSKTLIGSVPCDHDKFTVDKNGLYAVVGNQLDVFNHEGVKKQSLTIHSSEPSFITSKSQILAVAIANEIKVYDIQRREPRLTLTKQLPTFAKITSIKINSSGSMLAIQGIQKLLPLTDRSETDAF